MKQSCRKGGRLLCKALKQRGWASDLKMIFYTQHCLRSEGRELEMSESKGVTPVISQYLEIKSKHTDALLFFQMGDFYELFFEDAESCLTRVKPCPYLSRQEGWTAYTHVWCSFARF